MTDEKVKAPRGRSLGARLLTMREVAELKGCKIQSVHEAILRGDLRAWRFGRGWAIPKREADRWELAGHRKKRDDNGTG